MHYNYSVVLNFLNEYKKRKIQTKIDTQYKNEFIIEDTIFEIEQEIYPALLSDETRMELEKLLKTSENINLDKQRILDKMQTYMSITYEQYAINIPYTLDNQVWILKQMGYNNFQCAVFIDVIKDCFIPFKFIDFVTTKNKKEDF